VHDSAIRKFRTPSKICLAAATKTDSVLSPDTEAQHLSQPQPGAVAAGGLTVIANAPNPAGQMLPKMHLLHDVSPVSLLPAGLAATAIMLTIFKMSA
jgi:hypothetical protein